MLYRSAFLAISLFLTIATANAQSGKGALGAIRQEDIKKDLYTMADDHFRGREAGTLDELKASVWLAEEARKAGLEPAGDDGTYFQFFPLIRERVSANSTLSIGERSFVLWKDAIVYEPSFATVQAPLVFLNDPETAVAADIAGKAVALQFSDKGIKDPRVHVPTRYGGIVIAAWAKKLAALGAKAIVFVSDDLADKGWARAAQYANRGSYQIEG
ncbi:MAG TPA: peptidase M28, partial [Chitinophaga sp.]